MRRISLPSPSPTVSRRLGSYRIWPVARVQPNPSSRELEAPIRVGGSYIGAIEAAPPLPVRRFSLPSPPPTGGQRLGSYRIWPVARVKLSPRLRELEASILIGGGCKGAIKAEPLGRDIQVQQHG
ncbi:hypothetical protein E2562_010711 [Oryza meyeriana var. granulata]|uniref:Uncharacterized protein n=1 Tax=Oryza meyeriana var. granulata TaxID=110450 RepID=A0A6G1EW20_9ORYZ|nr:hypothetical protein E2562_010711 [Oryza meyeriana var. granulata]